MASSNLYKKFDNAQTLKNREGGYKNVVYYAPIETFESLKAPAASPTVLGDKKKITTAHTFATDEGFIALTSKLHSVTMKTDSVGEDESARSSHVAEFIVLGDSAEHLEQFEGIKATPGIWLLKDSACASGEFIQLGDDCLQATFKFEFTGNTTKEGLKEYKGTVTILDKKYYYSSTVTEKP
jgi:hypothetical protein